MFLLSKVNVGSVTTDAEPTVLTSAVAHTNAEPMVPTMPSGIVAGDMLMCFLMRALAAAATYTPNTGWSVINFRSDTVNELKGYFKLYHKIAEGSDVLSINADSTLATFITVRLSNPGDDVIEWAASNQGSAVSTHPTPALTTVSTGVPCLWLKLVTGGASLNITAGPSGYTEVNHFYAAESSHTTAWLYQKTGTTGTESANSFTSSDAQFSYTLTLCIT